MAAFSDADWGNLVKSLVSILGPGAQAYSGRRVARLVAAIPYLSGSEDPDRFSLSNLLTLHAATVARTTFDHRQSDDVELFRRLACFKCGSKADPRVLKYGLNLLALVMISDYVKDAADDRAAGKYNPVNAGVWNAAALKKALNEELAADKASAAAYADFMTPEEAVASWWLD